MRTLKNALASVLMLGSTSLVAQPAASNAVVVTYQMDLFSIISFALAIAAFIVSLFMGWLSWEFYKKSSDASEKSQQAVTKIETAVLSIQSDITEIVRRAVGYWTGGTPEQDVSDTSALAKKVDEMSVQIDLVGGNAANKHELDSKLAELVKMQRDQIAALNASVAEAKVRAIFPGIADRGPVAEVTHTVTSNTESEMSGQIVLSVQRPSRVVTATAKFDPPFSNATALDVSLIDAPSGKLGQVRLNSGIGRFGDFNIHLHPLGGAASGLVDPGTYVVEYKATSAAKPAVSQETHPK